MRHLKAFHVFHIAAASKSYTQAALKLNITHGAVSKQVKTLEAYLDQTLFYRQGRDVRLTQEGELLAQYTQRAFGALGEGIDALSKLGSRCLNVSCEPTLTMRWLMPRLAAFNLEHQVDVRLSTAGGPVNLGENGLSMAIRRDDFEIPSEYLVTPLVNEWVGPVCSPDYWSSLQNNFADIALLHSQTRPNAWQDWLLDNATDKPEICHKVTAALAAKEVGRSQQLAHFYFCLQAAQDGLGMAMGSYPLVQDELLSGRLIAPFQFSASGHQYILLSKKDAKQSLEQVFKAWLVDSFSNSLPC